jgi:surface protein
MNQQNFFFRLLSTLVFAILLFNSSTIHAQAEDFVTKWFFPYENTQITFNALTIGVVDYTWITSSNNSGNGSFTKTTPGAVTLSVYIAGGDTVTLRMKPNNIRRFFIDNGPNQSKLKEVSQWGTVLWSSMNSAFKGCENLKITASDVPNLTNVTDMSYMFAYATTFNSPIGNWNTENVTDMSSMFEAARDFNQPIGNWNTEKVTDMSNMFHAAKDFNQPIGEWNTEKVLDMRNMFSSAKRFNQPINDWNTTNVANMSNMFYAAGDFNQPIGNWNTNNVADMSGMFSRASIFNQPIGDWNTEKVTNIHRMFYLDTSFNQPIGDWDTGNVTFMVSVFDNALHFNQPIGDWDTGNVTFMSFMFYAAADFNQPIGNWNTDKLTDMRAMFGHATSFNQPIGNWNTNNVADMSGMFVNAFSFNQPIGDWNTEKVIGMSEMFGNAFSFNQDIGNWSLDAVDFPSLQNMLSNSGMDCGNYTSTLNGWRANNPSVTGLKLGATGLQYGTNAIADRDALINDQNWVITGDSLSGSECNIPTSAGNLGSRQQNLQIYPNPVSPSTTLHVVVTGVELSPEAIVRILDLQGQVVHQQTLSTKTELQLSRLVPSVYLLEATDGKTIWRERVVVVY